MEENITSSVITDTHQNGISFFGTKKRKLNYENAHFPRGAKLLQSSFNTTLPAFAEKVGKSREKQLERSRNSCEFLERHSVAHSRIITRILDVRKKLNNS